MLKQVSILLILLLSLTMLGCADDRTLIISTPSSYIDGDLNVTGKITSLGRIVDRTNNVIIDGVNVNNTITETVIYNEPIYTDELDVGTILKIELNGLVSTVSASDSLTVRIKLNNITKQTYVMTPKVVSNAGLHIKGTSTTRTTGVSGLRAVHQEICVVDDCSHLGGVGIYDTTIDQNLSVTVQWNNAKVGNDFTLLQGFMEFKH